MRAFYPPRTNPRTCPTTLDTATRRDLKSKLSANFCACNNKMRLDAVRAVVTGAAGGLGRVFCKQLLASGAKVMATDFDAAQLADMQGAARCISARAGASQRWRTHAACVRATWGAAGTQTCVEIDRR